MQHRAVFLLASALLLAGCHKKISTAAWITHTSPDGRFTARFPETPKESQMHAPVGTIHQYSVVQPDGRAYHILWNDYPPEAFLNTDQASLLEPLRRDFNSNGKKTIAEKNIALGSTPGQEITIDVDGKLEQRVRLFLVNARLYQIMTYAPVADKDDADLAEFLDGFALTSAATKPER